MNKLHEARLKLRNELEAPALRKFAGFSRVIIPKTAKAVCLMTELPGNVEPKQLRELHSELKVPKAPIERISSSGVFFGCRQRRLSPSGLLRR